MKKLLFVLCLILLVNVIHAQYLVNGSFENWFIKTHYAFPDNWTIHGDPLIINQSVQQEFAGYDGSYAMKLTTIDTNNFGFALLGAVEADTLNNLSFKGYPFSTPGDTLRLWYKAGIQSGDAALVVVRITKNGNLINEVQHLITGSHNTWTPLKLAVNPLMLQPDSVFIGFVSSYPFGAPFQQTAGSWITIDNIYFTQGTNTTPITIPNHSFENWSFAQTEEPNHWLSSNSYLVSNQMLNVEKTFNVYEGTYALKMSNVNLDGSVVSGFVSNSTADLLQGGVPFNRMPEHYYGAFKYQPVANDTAFVNVIFYKNGNQIAGDFFQIYDSSGVYQYFERPLFLSEQPDTLRVEIFSGENLGSVLFIDALDFSCNMPSNLSEQNITPTGASLLWDENGDAGTWDIEYGPFPLLTGSGTQVQTTTKPFTLSNLLPGTRYDYFVRAVCAAGKNSVWAANSFKTECEVLNFPLTEDFESLNLDPWPDCWRKIETGSASMTAGDFMQYTSPSKSLRVLLNQNDTALLISPFSGVHLNMLQLTFKAKRTDNTHPLTLKVGAMTNSEDKSTFEAYATVNLQTVFTPHTIYYNAYVGSGTYMALMLTADGYNEIYLDDIALAYLPLCLPPTNLSVSNITNNTAFIYWTAGGNEVLWDIKYGDVGFDPATEGTSINSVNQNNTTISGLNPGTSYDLYLRADCGSGNKSIWVHTSFQTLCQPFILPFTENFDNTPGQSIPTCWQYYKTGPSTAWVVDWNQSTSSTKSLYMNAGAGDSVFVFLPLMNSPMDTMMLMFKAKKESGAGPSFIEIGVVADVNDITTFMPISQFNLFNSFKSFAYLFNNYQGQAGHIALRLLASDATAAFVDDVEVRFLPSCMPPYNLNTGALSDTSVGLTWSAGGTETLWDIAYGLYGFDIATEGQHISNHNQPGITINGLEKDVHYEIYVRASCGGGNKSIWAGIAFTTPCMPDTIPMTENFDNLTVPDLPACWRSYITGASEVQSLDWGMSTSGLQSLYVYLGAGDSAFIIFPYTAAPLDTLMLVFDAKKDSWAPNALMEVGVVGNYPDMATYNAYYQFQLSDNFKSYTALFHYFQGISGRLALRLISSNATAVFIDDIGLNYLPSCLPPYNISLNNLTDTLADISWMPGGSETLWDLKYGAAGFNPANEGQLVGGINVPEAVIGGLMHGAAYDVYVRADCGGSDTSIWAQISFTTFCLPLNLPLTEDFELTQLHAVPNCWQSYTTGYAQVEVLAQSYANSGTNSLFLSVIPGDSALIILPKILPDIDTVMLSFYGRKLSGNQAAILEAGVISNPADINSYLPLHQITLSHTFKPYVLTFDSYLGQGGQIVLRAISADVATISLDDITLAYLPVCAPPQNITIANIGDTSAHISWTAAGNVQFWNITYGFAGFDPLTEGTVLNNILQNDTTLGGLQPGTLYDIYLMADCGGNDTSLWTSAAFHTLCQNIHLPLTEDFENTIPGNLPLCWEKSISGSGEINVINWSVSVSGNRIMRLLCYEGSSMFLMSPDFLHHIDTVALTFHAKRNPLMGSAEIVVGTMQSQLLPASFIPIDTFLLTDNYMAYNLYFFNSSAQHHCIAFAINTFGEDVEIDIDDVSFEFAQECNPPGNLTFENITDSSVLVKWQSFGVDTLWHILYGLQGFDVQTEGILVENISQQEFLITGLQTAASYEIYMLANCGNGILSHWRGPIGFKTGLLINKTVLAHLNCPGDTLGKAYVTPVSGTQPYSYQWFTTPPQYGDTAYGLGAGIHIVKVVDANAYFSFDTIVINSPPAFYIEKMINPVLCFSQSNGSIAINVSGGHGGYTYLWSTGHTQTQISNMPAGTYLLTVTDAQGCKAYDTIQLPQPDNLIINTVLHKNISCRGFNNGKLAVSAAGGTPPYQYQWNTNPVVYDTVVSNLGVGFHRVTVTDANSCLAIRTYSITQPGQALGATLSVNHASCANNNSGSAMVNPFGGTPPYTYAWSNGASTQGIVNLSGGNYKMTLTDANGCLFVDSVLVKEPKITLTKTDVLCHGQHTGVIVLKVENFSTNFNISWVNNIDSVAGSSVVNNVFVQNISGLAAGTYYVAVSDTLGCAINGSITITQPQLMSVSVTKTDLLCYGQSNGSITIAPQVVYPPYSYSWSTGATSGTINNLTAGTYVFTVTDGLQCQFVGSVSLLEPPALLAAPLLTNVACKGDSSGTIDLNVSGGTPPYSYIWNNGSAGAVNSGLIAGGYAYTVTDHNQCQKSDTTSINEPDTYINITAQVVNVLCFGDNTGAISTIISGGVPPYAYAWSSGQVSPHLTGMAAGTYMLTLTDNVNCQKTDTFTINQPAQAMSIGFQITTHICDGQTSGGAVKANVTGGNPPYYYFWSNDEFGQEITGLTVGVYTVTVIDASGCSNFDSVALLPNIVFVEGINGATTVFEDSIVVYYVNNAAQSSFNWSITNGVIVSGNGLNTDTVFVQWGSAGQGIVHLVKTDTNNCSGDTTLYINIIPYSGLFMHETAGKIQVFPNPAANIIFVEIESPDDLGFMMLYDARGRMLGVYELSTRSSISLDGLSNGVYFIRIGESVLPFIKSDGRF